MRKSVSAMWSASRAAVHIEKGRSSTRATRRTFAHSRSSPLSSDCVFGGGTGGTGVLDGESYIPRGTKSRDRAVRVRSVACRYLPVPPFGTTPIRRKPFEYHQYRLYGPQWEAAVTGRNNSSSSRSRFRGGFPAGRAGPPSQLEPDTGQTQRKWSKLTSSCLGRVTRGDQTARGY